MKQLKKTVMRKKNNKFLFKGSKILFLLLTILTLQVICSALYARKQPYTLQAGASFSNITPYLDGGIVGNYGVPPEAKYIHDELYAKSLVLDDGHEQIAIVIVDNIGIAREVCDYAKELIHEKTGMKKENILIAATHTHSSVSVGGIGEKRRGFNYGKPLDDYQIFVARRISDGVRRAIYNKVPAEIGWGSVQVPQHVFNRRWLMKPGTDIPDPFGGQDKAKMNPAREDPNLLKPAGPTDPEVYFVSVRAIDGRPIALLANYSLHYVGGLPRDHISADYFGVFTDRFQQLIGADRLDPPFVAIMSNGTSGDINNINFRRPAEDMKPYQKMRIVAGDVAEEIFKQYQNILYKTDVKLGAVYGELNFKVRKPAPAMLAKAIEVVANPAIAKKERPHELTYAQRTIQIQEEWPDNIDIVVQALRIGDLGIAAIPFEVFVETGLEIKDKSPFTSTFTIGIANGTYGYLPTPEQHELGGYETWLSTNRVEKEASRKIVKLLLEQFADLMRTR
jgi:hypothetical protein